MNDLFEHQDTLPTDVAIIVGLIQEGMDYEELSKIRELLEANGYTFEMGLDAVPYNLQRTVKTIAIMRFDEILFFKKKVTGTNYEAYAKGLLSAFAMFGMSPTGIQITD